jgi:hypothetical protein
MIKIIIIAFILISNVIFSQHLEYKHHGLKGRHEIDWRYRSIFNPHINRYETIRHCRRLIWVKRNYTGDVYYYDDLKQTWYKKWETGEFWYCYWSTWNKC